MATTPPRRLVAADRREEDAVRSAGEAAEATTLIRLGLRELAK